MGGLSYLLAAFLPAMLYLCLIYVQTSNYVSIRKSAIFPFFGMCSILMTSALYLIFPEAMPDIQYFFGTVVYDPSFFDIWKFHTLHVGLIEEVSKFTMLFLGLQLMRFTKGNTLYSYMFYGAIVGALFGMCENFSYFIGFANSIYYDPTEMTSLMLGRSIFSVVLHMITCMFVGYFYALSTLKKSILGKVFKVVFGLFLGILFHGYFNTHLYFTTEEDLIGGFASPQTILIVVSGLAVCYFMARDLINYKREDSKQYTMGSAIRRFFH